MNEGTKRSEWVSAEKKFEAQSTEKFARVKFSSARERKRELMRNTMPLLTIQFHVIFFASLLLLILYKHTSGHSLPHIISVYISSIFCCDVTRAPYNFTFFFSLSVQTADNQVWANLSVQHQLKVCNMHMARWRRARASFCWEGWKQGQRLIKVNMWAKRSA